MMIADLEEGGIADALRVLEDGKALRRANDAVVEFLREHPIAAQWGRDVDCASDAMSLDVSRSISTARMIHAASSGERPFTATSWVTMGSGMICRYQC